MSEETFKRAKLSPREIEMITLAARGKKYSEIAASLFMAEDTVKAHIENVRRKLNAINKTHAVALAIILNHIRYEDILPDDNSQK